MATDSVVANWTDGKDDSEVEKIAQWVVDQINQIEEKKLELVSVIDVQVTIPNIGGGVLYWLLIEVQDEDGSLHRYVALVLVPLEGDMELLDYYEVEFDQETIGGWTDASKDVGIEDQAKFAIDEYNKKEGTTLEFTNLENAQKQLVAGILYSLTLEATHDGQKQLYQATVKVIPWQKIKELEDFKPLLLNTED